MSCLINSYSRFPVAFVKGSGAILWDDKGKDYIDFCSGISVTNLGHNFTPITEAICLQASKLIHTSNIFEVPLQEELARLIGENSFGGKTFFCNSGAEANEGAVKLARLYAKKKSGGEKYKIISMNNSFHGRTYGTLSLTGQIKVQKGFTPIADFAGYAEFNNINSVKAAIEFGNVAAVIIELYQGEGGVVPADKNYVKDLRKLCSETDTLLIIDEIQTGYGRTGELFAYKLFDIEPDIMTLAKAMANGLPMGAFIAKPQLADYLTPGTHGSTFGGTPLVSAVGIAVINEMIKPNFLNQVKEKGNRLRSILSNELKSGYAIRGDGLLIGVQTPYEPKNTVEACLNEGLIVTPASNNSVRLYPPLNISNDLLIKGGEKFIKAIKKLEETK